MIKKKLLCIGCLFFLSGISSTGYGAILHGLDYDQSPGAMTVTVGEKVFNGGPTGEIRDKVFKDGLGREIYFRGWNVSGTVKLVESGFKPFLNEADADNSFRLLKKTTGANAVRFTIGWEGVHPAPDTIDYNYLNDIIAQMKRAIHNKMYIMIDYHQDLFSRHLFNQDSWHTGNGAPAWVTPAADYPDEYCGIICAAWSQNLLTNEAIRMAFRNFWNNAEFGTTAGNRKMQDEFLWQLGQMTAYVKAQLTDEEFAYILGVDPVNEPSDGGMEGLSPAEWDNQKLWPFYQRARTVLSANGFQDKFVFAEPLVFWNTRAGFICPRTGGGHLTSPPGEGFVFNSHFYDAGRMGTDTTGVDNGTYLGEMDIIRNEARFLELPVFLSEFGMWLDDIGSQDTVRIVKSVYQGAEISDAMKSTKDRYADFYAPLISATQWHWDTYYDQHNEYMNGNPDKLLAEKDAWNEENFSVISEGGTQLNMDFQVVQRGYPRVVSGAIMNFYYNDLSHDGWDKLLNWATIRAGGIEYFKNKNFMLLTWKGRTSDAPTEIFIPKQYASDQLLVITESRIYNQTLVKDAVPLNTADEAVLLTDMPGQANAGSRLLIWDDLSGTENADTIHFAVIAPEAGLTTSETAVLQAALTHKLQVLKKNPVYMTGKMTDSGYPDDMPVCREVCHTESSGCDRVTVCETVCDE